MTQEQVDRIFRDYQQMVGRCAFLSVEIERTMKEMDRALSEATPLDFLKLSASFMQTPRGTGAGDPTGRAAQLLADGEPTEQARSYQRRLAVLKTELADRQTAMAYVDAWLKGLKNAEQLVLKRRVVEHLPWSSVAREYEDVFGEQRTVDALKKIKSAALKKVYEMAG